MTSTTGKATNPIIVQGNIRGKTMRKLLAILVAIAMVGVFTPMALAAEHDTINVTLTPGGVAHIDVYNTTAGAETQAIYKPTASLGDHNDTTTMGPSGDGGQYTIDNTNGIAVSIKISAPDTAAWTLVDDTTPGNDEVCLQWSQDAGIGWTSIANSPGGTFIADLAAPDGTQTFDLGVYMPPSSSTNVPQTTIITFTATAL